MRQSYRDKQSRKSRMNREKQEKSFSKQEKGGDVLKGVPTSSQDEYDDLVYGRNAVLELLKSDKDINKIFIERGEKHGSIHEIIAKAKESRIVTVEVERAKLDSMTKENHQGVIASVAPFKYCQIEDILEVAKQRQEMPFVLLLDGIEDPHNLGAIIRTAETAGVHGIIIPKRRSVAVNSTVSKVSAGATNHMKVARVSNLNEAIRKLKENGLWIIGTDGEATNNYFQQDLTGPIGLIIGSEGFGMSKLLKENTDILVKIPMKGQITSLNASVAAGIVMYEVVKQNDYHKIMK